MDPVAEQIAAGRWLVALLLVAFGAWPVAGAVIAYLFRANSRLQEARLADSQAHAKELAAAFGKAIETLDEIEDATRAQGEILNRIENGAYAAAKRRPRS